MTRGTTLAAAACAALLIAQGAGAAPPALRVCADPNNLPFSNSRGEGFENRLAERLARHFGTRVEYTWWPQRRGFLRHTLNAGACDLVMGMPAGSGGALTTRPYYRSSYVLVTRSDRGWQISSLEDARLERLRIGVQMIGDDYANSPPAHALAARGLTRNIIGYSVLGDYSTPNPPARIVDAVAGGAVDAAVVWGPLAGYFARRASRPLTVTTVTPPAGSPLPFAFDIAMGVRTGDAARRAALDRFIATHRRAIEALLESYGVPLLPPGGRS